MNTNEHKMQPGDYIPKEWIEDVEHLGRIRRTVGAPAPEWRKWAGTYDWSALRLNDRGDLVWAAVPEHHHGRIIHPAELLPGEWHPWRGGENPVPGQEGREVEVEYPDGHRYIAPPTCFRWDHRNNDGDIISFRILPEEEEMNEWDRRELGADERYVAVSDEPKEEK